MYVRIAYKLGAISLIQISHKNKGCMDVTAFPKIQTHQVLDILVKRPEAKRRPSVSHGKTTMAYTVIHIGSDSSTSIGECEVAHTQSYPHIYRALLLEHTVVEQG